MSTNKLGQVIYSDNDIMNHLMSGGELPDKEILVHDIDNIELINKDFELSLSEYIEQDITIKEFDRINQANWHMPAEYKKLDITEYILGLCDTPAETQRCATELLLYQEHNLFNLLRYLKYLVDTMKSNGVIWGVGRGSSVSSYILYKLEIHRIDSMYYGLDVTDFLR
jgi:DNA polymerase III alpha subunit